MALVQNCSDVLYHEFYSFLNEGQALSAHQSLTVIAMFMSALTPSFGIVGQMMPK